MIALFAAQEGCRCGQEPPSDLIELVPAPAVFVLELDLAGLREAPVMAALKQKRGAEARRGVRQTLGFEPTRDLHRVVVAAAGRGDGQLDYLVLLLGRLERGRILDALERSGSELSSKRRSGQTVYRDRSGLGPQMLFPGRRTLALVSPGWLDLLLRRLRGHDRSVLATNPALAAQIRTARADRTRRAWVVSQLSAATSRYLASRLGWSELSQVAAIRGSVRADQHLRLEAWLALERETPAAALEKRLAGVAGRLRRMKTTRQGRRVQVRLALTPEEIEALLEKLRSPKRQPAGRPGG